MAMHQFKFTKGRVDQFTCPSGKKEAVARDTEAPDLCLRVRSDGPPRFMFRTKLGGKNLRMIIGAPESWSLSDARAEARRLRGLVDRGIDPRQEREGLRQAAISADHAAKRERLTLADVWPVYTQARHDSWGEHSRNAHEKAMTKPGQPRKRSSKLTIAGPLWSLRDQRLVDLTPQVLVRWLETECQTRPTGTAQVYRMLRACLVWVSEQPDYAGLINSSELFNKTVRRAVPRAKAKADSLQREQLNPWFQSVLNCPNPYMSAYFQTLLLTGARRGEVAAMRWSDVDFVWLSIQLRDKVEGDRVIPLPPYLADRLYRLPRKGEFVFHSPRAACGHIVSPNKDHNRVLDAAGLPRVTLHGLRRSFGSLSEWVECPVGVVAQIQGHKPSALAEKHYRQRPLDLLRMWHTKIERWILIEAGINQPLD